MKNHMILELCGTLEIKELQTLIVSVTVIYIKQPGPFSTGM